MTGNTTDNTSALRRAEVYSSVILDEIKGGFLPDGIHRDVSEFSDGDTFNITTFGEVVLREVTEDQDIKVDPIDSGSITMTITEYPGAGSYMTDKVRQDSHQAGQFDAAIVPKHLLAIKEKYETDLLAVVNQQTLANANAINGFAHRFSASGTAGIIALDDIIYMKLAMDKANLPSEGRILIVDGLVEATLNSLTNITDVSNNPRFEGIVETGFAKNMKFLKNIYGFDIYLSDRLPEVNSEALDTTGITVPAPSNNTTVTSGVVCQALCLADELTMPYMGAWREMPVTEGVRNARRKRDEYFTTARWGFGLQRPQSVIGLVTSRVAY